MSAIINTLANLFPWATNTFWAVLALVLISISVSLVRFWIQARRDQRYIITVLRFTVRCLSDAAQRAHDAERAAGTGRIASQNGVMWEWKRISHNLDNALAIATAMGWPMATLAHVAHDVREICSDSSCPSRSNLSGRIQEAAIVGHCHVVAQYPSAGLLPHRLSALTRGYELLRTSPQPPPFRDRKALKELNRLLQTY